MSSRNLLSSNLNFSVLIHSMSQIFRQRGVQTRAKHSYRIFLKGLCWVSVCKALYDTLCSMSWGVSGFIFCLIVPIIFAPIL